MGEIKKIPLQEYYNSLSKLGKVRFIAQSAYGVRCFRSDGSTLDLWGDFSAYTRGESDC